MHDGIYIQSILDQTQSALPKARNLSEIGMLIRTYSTKETKQPALDIKPQNLHIFAFSLNLQGESAKNSILV
jgi:hypothetical protein